MLKKGVALCRGRARLFVANTPNRRSLPRAASPHRPFSRQMSTQTGKSIKDMKFDLPDFNPPSAEEWAQIDADSKWHDALRGKMNAEPGSLQARAIYYQDEDIVVVYDRYPKAYVHLLIIPKKSSLACDVLQQLGPQHLKLLQKFAVLSAQIAEKISANDPLLQNFFKLHGSAFMAGFHAVPSLTPIHMHLISRDMVSPSLKTAVHYLSFTTPFFIPLSEVYNELKSQKYFGDKKHLEDHLNGELICHLDQTNFLRKMAKLRKHLASLWAQNEADMRGETYEIVVDGEGAEEGAEIAADTQIEQKEHRDM